MLANRITKYEEYLKSQRLGRFTRKSWLQMFIGKGCQARSGGVDPSREGHEVISRIAEEGVPVVGARGPHLWRSHSMGQLSPCQEGPLCQREQECPRNMVTPRSNRKYFMQSHHRYIPSIKSLSSIANSLSIVSRCKQVKYLQRV